MQIDDDGHTQDDNDNGCMKSGCVSTITLVTVNGWANGFQRNHYDPTGYGTRLI